MNGTYALLAALSGALAVLWFVSLAQNRVRGAARQVTDYTTLETPPTLSEQLGSRVLRVVGLDIGLWEEHLRWAHLGGQLTDWSVARVLGTGLLFAVVGVAAAVILQTPVFGIGAVLLFILPFLMVRSQGLVVRRQALRALPEMAALIAAEMAASNPPDHALRRAAEFAGPLGTILGHALAESSRSGRPLFSRRPTKGVLIEALSTWNLPALSAFARQIDLAAAKGVAGAEQMSRTARDLAREYREGLLSRAEKLESELVMPSALFFFLPFVAAVMLPIVYPLLQAL